MYSSNVYKPSTTKFGRFLDAVVGKKCPCCNTRGHMQRTYYSYNRGYNTLCQQAAGDSGMWCRNCLTVIWHQTDEQFEQELLRAANWCVPDFRIRQFIDSSGDESILTDLGYKLMNPISLPDHRHRVASPSK